MDLWMQIEGTKLIFIINISVLDFFKFASRMPQIAQILVSTFKIFRGGMPPDPLEISSFFSFSNFRLWNMEFLQLSDTTRAREIDAELKKNKWRNEWLNPTRAWVAPGPLLDTFLLFSKSKIFHSHPCTSVGIDASVKNKWKFWRWLKEKVETGLCLARFASRRCVWVTASKRSMCRVRLSVPGVKRYGPINQSFVCSFVSSLLHIILILASFVAETRILAEMKIENRGKKIFSVGKNR